LCGRSRADTEQLADVALGQALSGEGARGVFERLSRLGCGARVVGSGGAVARWG
jgi:hypothetical protein